MRVNVYAEEMTDRIEIISKTTENGTFTGLRFYLELPVTLRLPGQDAVQVHGPFLHHPDDDDSAAVTFWGKSDLRTMLRVALAELDNYYTMRERVNREATRPEVQFDAESHDPLETR